MIQGVDCRTVSECLFTANEIQSERTLLSGSAFVLTLGHPRWTAALRVEAPTRQAFAVWDARLTTLKRSKTPFLLTPKFQAIPRGGAVDDSSLDVLSVDKEDSTITLSGAGTYTAKMGDMISYKTAAGGWWIGKVLSEVNVVSPYEITIPVWPAPATPHATANPRRYYPFGEFTIDGTINKEGGLGSAYFEFNCKQLIRVSSDPASNITPPDQGENLAEIEALTL